MFPPPSTSLVTYQYQTIFIRYYNYILNKIHTAIESLPELPTLKNYQTTKSVLVTHWIVTTVTITISTFLSILFFSRK